MDHINNLGYNITEKDVDMVKDATKQLYEDSLDYSKNSKWVNFAIILNAGLGFKSSTLGGNTRGYRVAGFLLYSLAFAGFIAAQ